MALEEKTEENTQNGLVERVGMGAKMRLAGAAMTLAALATACAPTAQAQAQDETPVRPVVRYGDVMVAGDSEIGQTAGEFNGKPYAFTLEEAGPTGLQLVARYDGETDTFILGPEVAAVMNYNARAGLRGHHSNVGENASHDARFNAFVAGEDGVTIWRYQMQPTEGARDVETLSYDGSRGLEATFAEDGKLAIGYLGVDADGFDDFHYVGRME